jgi:hypothetical protein
MLRRQSTYKGYILLISGILELKIREKVITPKLEYQKIEIFNHYLSKHVISLIHAMRRMLPLYQLL